MTTAELTCWNCGATLSAVPLPVGRGEECPQCVASIRACRMCAFYDPHASNACREPMADPVADKEAANACDYFRPRSVAEAAGDDEAAQAKAKLDSLFGGRKEDAGGGLAGEAEAFRDKGESEAETARRKLDELFGKKGD